MINNEQRKRLIENWDIATCGFPYAEVRLYAPRSNWECYLIALNPDDMDEVICLLKAEGLEVTNWTLREIKKCYDANGYPPCVDFEYRRKKVSEIIKKLREEE